MGGLEAEGFDEADVHGEGVIHWIFQAVFGVDNFRSMLAAPTNHPERVAGVGLDVNQLALVKPDIDPAPRWAYAANSGFPFQISIGLGEQLHSFHGVGFYQCDIKPASWKRAGTYGVGQVTGRILYFSTFTPRQKAM